MNRETLLQILAAADESKLIDACRAIGIDGITASGADQGGGMDLGEQPSAEGLSSWNATKIQMPESKRAPLYNKGDFVEGAAGAKPRTMDKPGSYLEGQSLPLESFAAPDAGGDMV